ncbi:hypothetical protein [Anaerotignum sp.]|uniref:hypothetical protein n=1 Tax=Anaerotignum sp. TaxID=2039241 RepID=UPI0027152B6A|nr:hypothetical protein [Anaerotignum sp.]
MDKKTNKTTERTQKNVNRTEFAQEYSIDTGSQSNNKCDKTNKVNKTNKMNKTNNTNNTK